MKTNTIRDMEDSGTIYRMVKGKGSARIKKVLSTFQRLLTLSDNNPIETRDLVV